MSVSSTCSGGSMREGRKRVPPRQDEDSPRLIRAVQKEPSLWDKSVADYRDKGAKERAWTIIAKSFYNTTPQNVKDHWYAIRRANSNNKKYREMKERSGAPANKLKKYIYHDLLTFLEGQQDELDLEEGNLSSDNDEGDDSDGGCDTLAENHEPQNSDVSFDAPARSPLRDVTNVNARPRGKRPNHMFTSADENMPPVGKETAGTSRLGKRPHLTPGPTPCHQRRPSTSKSSRAGPFLQTIDEEIEQEPIDSRRRRGMIEDDGGDDNMLAHSPERRERETAKARRQRDLDARRERVRVSMRNQVEQIRNVNQNNGNQRNPNQTNANHRNAQANENMCRCHGIELAILEDLKKDKADHFEAFLLSLAPRLRELNKKKSRRLMLHFMEQIVDAEEEEEMAERGDIFP